ncbi:MAG: UDP-N-acetylglucosamine--N-acetylmuramyl-(pentapeptide) pyrophosphoryl-undecaprenol N-acetylglucosamine transferase [Verrucomicrobiota bacterium]
MARTFLIACGGTGGHLAPGVAVAEELVSRGHHCGLVISRKQVDSRLIRKHETLRFFRSDGVAFGKKPREIVRFCIGLVRSLRQGLAFVRNEKPDLVLAFGGFLSVGVVFAARLRGIPVVLHEANRVPGRAIRFLKRFACRIYLPPKVSLPGYPEEKVRDFGYPLRKGFGVLDKALAREEMGLEKRGLLVTVFGGSQGASSLNEWVDEKGSALLGEGVNILCIRGLSKGRDESPTITAVDGETYRVLNIDFCDQMPQALSASDLVISRAGAGSIAELTRCKVPSVLVPFPSAADDHQLFNARYFSEEGGCLVLVQEEIDQLEKVVLSLLRDEARLEEIRIQLARLETLNRQKELIDDLESLAEGQRSLEEHS